MKVVFVIYTTIVLSMMWMFTYSITRPHKVKPKFRVSFYGWIGFLIFVGVGIHVLTFAKIPWVSWDLNRHKIKVDKEYNIDVGDYRFNLPDGGLVIQKGQMVRFNLKSLDYTYGFGLFRGDGSMVFQMQVVPGSRNDIVWKFDKPDTYSIRSTEYSGPKGGSMFVADAVTITGGTTTAQSVSN
jgi:cytochrome c oxidase subunit 2